ncbi:MAG: NYN domain-containing protein [Elusimicrobia bacterium]|nr:NYN domain-containing protein [Elusimicrobiota bacterium]
MPEKRAMFFVDGENLTFRYQDMLQAGAKLRNHINPDHIPDTLVWHARMCQVAPMTLRRVNYYTSVVGDDDKIAEVKNKIAEITYTASAFGVHSTGQIVPKVYKKEKSSRKSRIVDINICIDSLRHAHQPDVDLLIFASGDGDYLPLIREIMRHGKQVYLMAFSSGLDQRLRHSVDHFFDMDVMFFEQLRDSSDARP